MITSAEQTLLKPIPQTVSKGEFSVRYLPDKRRLSGILWLIALACASTTCSNKALYENIQQNQQRACEDLPIPQQTQCKSLHDTGYEEYRRELEQIGEN